MQCVLLLILVLIHFNFLSAKRHFILVQKYEEKQLVDDFGGHLPVAIYDVTRGFPSFKLTIVYDKSIDIYFLTYLANFLLKNEISLTIFNITTEIQQDLYVGYLMESAQKNEDLYVVHFCTPKMAEHVLILISDYKLARRNIIFMFYWGSKAMYRYFVRNIHETMKVVVITNPRLHAYRLYYSQSTSHKQHNLHMYNWWIDGRGLFHHPTLPESLSIYKDFKGRLIYVPVIHKPPWHFVHYTNESLKVLGGRDDKLLNLIATKLNFRYKYFDPPERIQGTSFNINGTFDGVLGLIWEKECEFFVGDVALTQERFKIADFSFLTLADSGAFVTHSPSKLNEALALIRPFNWKVWPAIIATVILSGPLLYLIIALPNTWHPTFKCKDQLRLMMDCCWYALGIFLSQAYKAPSESHKSRFFIILLSISATYVIGDMYAANLTSLLARPGREKPINNLAQLEEAMVLRGYRLIVEKHSSSYSLLENGTGIYGRLWEIMNYNFKDPNKFLVDSVERGVKLVRDGTNIAVMAGRETLFFDIQRFGPSNFHLSEKLNTAYSAIAMQLGCPYIDNFNKIIMSIFEAGILTKMTQDEYENLGKQQANDKDEDEEEVVDDELSARMGKAKSARNPDDEGKLQPINIKMLQGAFYLLVIGHFISGLVILLEMFYHSHNYAYKKKGRKRFVAIVKIKKRIHTWSRRAVQFVRIRFREAMNNAIVATLDYTE